LEETYIRPEISMAIGSVSGVISGAQGVTITGGAIRNVDTAAGTGANIVDSVQLSSGGVANPSANGADHAGTVGQAGGPVPTTPSGGLFSTRPDPTSRYLYETRSEFANYRAWASSDYLFKALGLNPNHLQKRLGDGLYEQRLIREQVAALTGRRFLSGYGDDDAQYTALLTAGATFAQQYGLRPGVSLSAEQMKALTSDIVWMESQTVTLPDGSQQQVLVPKVYLAQLGANALKPNGALITGDKVYIEGDSIVNRGGTIGGKGTQRAVLIASADIVNQGGTLQAGQLGLQAGGNIRNESLTVTLRTRAQNEHASTSHPHRPGRSSPVAMIISHPPRWPLTLPLRQFGGTEIETSMRPHTSDISTPPEDLRRRQLLRAGVALTGAAALLGAGCAATTPAQMRQTTVTSSAEDGVKLTVYESGNPNGRPVVFIHGFAQSHESWSKQMESVALQRELRLIAFDLRGHGDSDKPLSKDAYHDPARWAHDLRSVIRATGAQRPCVVAWSYGGRVLNDYLSVFGDAELGALNYVAATSSAERFGLGRSYALIVP
ncbi:MAG: alpha/beta fold hydrolase, partial [Comamonadaceae bacterium]